MVRGIVTQCWSVRSTRSGIGTDLLKARALLGVDRNRSSVDAQSCQGLL